MKSADLSLDTVARGAVPEKFDHALRAILDNVMDPNTPWDAKRSITITLSFRPHEDRRQMDVDADVTTKLANMKSDTGIAYIGQRDGEIVAVTVDPEQPDMFDKESPAGVIPIPQRTDRAQGAGT